MQAWEPRPAQQPGRARGFAHQRPRFADRPAPTDHTMAMRCSASAAAARPASPPPPSAREQAGGDPDRRRKAATQHAPASGVCAAAQAPPGLQFAAPACARPEQCGRRSHQLQGPRLPTRRQALLGAGIPTGCHCAPRPALGDHALARWGRGGVKAVRQRHGGAQTLGSEESQHRVTIVGRLDKICCSGCHI
ncbi:MAG: hypothetical protein J3K34DRAFT_417904 [Monoraphidium minutum]|nr:MAG: hypothetical protein J3K34DRAFT_417904 [Monoraphidium minutum]